ncbi:hypothetical protein DM860_005704 [Cuscuta australis]|uniref:Uncharacterized protein n=1 Tax=Cuscuta australis TaxID=267555 RepID=A0A328DSK7_9ASTE|nr:hypothetical protein DM860_005704 [Cuscuta australis]
MGREQFSSIHHRSNSRELKTKLSLLFLLVEHLNLWLTVGEDCGSDDMPRKECDDYLSFCKNRNLYFRVVLFFLNLLMIQVYCSVNLSRQICIFYIWYRYDLLKHWHLLHKCFEC